MKREEEATLQCCVGSGLGEVLSLLDSFEHPLAKRFSLLVKDVPLDVLVPEHAVWIDIVQDTNKVVEVGIELAEVVRTKRVGFCPMRPAFVACENLLEAGEELAVRHVEPIRPVKGRRE